MVAETCGKREEKRIGRSQTGVSQIVSCPDPTREDSWLIPRAQLIYAPKKYYVIVLHSQRFPVFATTDCVICDVIGSWKIVRRKQ